MSGPLAKSSLSTKNILLFRNENHPYMSPRPVPLKGALAIVTTRGRMRWTQTVPRTYGTGCGRPSRMVLTPQWLVSSWRRQLFQRRCQQSPITGEYEATVNHCVRSAGCSGVSVKTAPIVFFLGVGGCGCIKRPAFPRPDRRARR